MNSAKADALRAQLEEIQPSLPKEVTVEFLIPKTGAKVAENRRANHDF